MSVWILRLARGIRVLAAWSFYPGTRSYMFDQNLQRALLQTEK